MNKLLLIYLFLLLVGCFYDPPRKGKEIFIHNQTDEYVYVTDSLLPTGNIRLYDTVLVNKKELMLAKGNYIPTFNQWIYFLPEVWYKDLKENNIHKFALYFITRNDFNKNYEVIKSNKLYQVYYIDLDDVMKNQLTHVFYFKDSILTEHTYDIESIRNKK